ncbi:hypothetical protein B0T25DRAFT_5123 [Lasiosphaeria hispida]|uniref:Uncharacterized protein n=1 Tax=Lasiosphaeria hispida TaxID=260671 RepID=A0AAJ0MJ37_9PEZI|nr:hypothetical protein B0T25DRAFT_5123 [Lasiosphaeria hispida]
MRDRQQLTAKSRFAPPSPEFLYSLLCDSWEHGWANTQTEAGGCFQDAMLIPQVGDELTNRSPNPTVRRWLRLPHGRFPVVFSMSPSFFVLGIEVVTLGCFRLNLPHPSMQPAKQPATHPSHQLWQRESDGVFLSPAPSRQRKLRLLSSEQVLGALGPRQDKVRTGFLHDWTLQLARNLAPKTLWCWPGRGWTPELETTHPSLSRPCVCRLSDIR